MMVNPTEQTSYLVGFLIETFIIKTCHKKQTQYIYNEWLQEKAQMSNVTLCVANILT